MTDLALCADALWRAITFVSVAQLHLTDNPLVARAIEPSDVKAHPAGHWGTVPGNAWAITHIGLAAAQCRDLDVVPVIGAGHAGIVQLALAWLTGDLAKIRPQFSRDAKGLTALVSSFPNIDGLGSEVHPSLPVGSYVGGWLGGALAFAQGAALGATDRVLIPVIGDGECETPTTAAAWLAHHALPDSHVLPIVHLNGHRMGGPSLLGAMSDRQLLDYASGLGWEATVAQVATGGTSEHMTFHGQLMAGIDAVSRGHRSVVFLRCVKGWSGPIGAHKTPLNDPAGDTHQRAFLQRWLSSYRPHELFDADGQPIGWLAEALGQLRICGLPNVEPPHPTAIAPGSRGFSAEVDAVLRAHAEPGDFRIFSPDELASNRLAQLADKPWVTEVLAEEVLIGWLTGWTTSGRRGVLISYEAFAPLLLTSLIGQLKQRRLTKPTLPSINVLLTSYGWHNAYTHGDPSLITALLAADDPAVHVFTPADANRAAFALDDALRSRGRINVIIAGKHTTDHHPLDTVDEEREHGAAVWPHKSTSGEPDLVIVCAGDLAATVTCKAAERLRSQHGCRIRVVNIHDLVSLAAPAFHRSIGDAAPVLVATLGHPAVIWSFLARRLNRPVDVIGWREPPHAMPQHELASRAGLDVDGMIAAATALLDERREPR